MHVVLKGKLHPQTHEIWMCWTVCLVVAVCLVIVVLICRLVSVFLLLFSDVDSVIRMKVEALEPDPMCMSSMYRGGSVY